MGFVTGLSIIDCPASALNNAGAEEGARTDNTIAVKKIRTRQGDFPYVSAQAYRYWLRTTLEQRDTDWKAAPIFRETKIAYTDANPQVYWDDDLLGYMRAQGKTSDAKKSRADSDQHKNATPTTSELTRVSPFRVGTLVSIAPVRVVDDFGTMSRHDGDPVPHEHQFYRAYLKGLTSLNLSLAGTFFRGGRVGYKNLDDHREQAAKDANLAQCKVHGQPGYRLPHTERAKRCASLIRATASIEGGAKLSLHYTDVNPAIWVAAVTRGGNNILARVVQANDDGLPIFHQEVLEEVLRVYKDQLLSPLYVGWVAGFREAERERFRAFSAAGVELVHGHPREVAGRLAEDLEKSDNAHWFD